MLKIMLRLLFLCFLWHTTDGMTVDELISHYNEIFPMTHNRNAASHLWATYVIKDVQKRGNVTEAEIYELFSGFCPVSGSPVYPSSRNRWKNLQIKKATNTDEVVTGKVNFCCAPCSCDLEEFVRYDTMKILTKNGMKEFPVLVIGDPCTVPNHHIPRDASEVRCEDGKLYGATLSSHDYVVIGMVQPSSKPADSDASTKEHQGYCKWRREEGNYQGGMGTIFADLAKINPIS